MADVLYVSRALSPILWWQSGSKHILWNVEVIQSQSTGGKNHMNMELMSDLHNVDTKAWCEGAR